MNQEFEEHYLDIFLDIRRKITGLFKINPETVIRDIRQYEWIIRDKHHNNIKNIQILHAIASDKNHLNTDSQIFGMWTLEEKINFTSIDGLCLFHGYRDYEPDEYKGFVWILDGKKMRK